MSKKYLGLKLQKAPIAYHGSTVPFEEHAKPKKSAKGALNYGPGIYYATDPEEASAYAEPQIHRVNSHAQAFYEIQKEPGYREYQNQMAAKFGLKSSVDTRHPNYHKFSDHMLSYDKQKVAEKLKLAPNVRRSDVQVNNPFDPHNIDHAHKVLAVLGDKPGWQLEVDHKAGVDSLYNHLAHSPSLEGSWGERTYKLNQAIKQAGFDGIHDKKLGHIIAFDPKQIKPVYGAPKKQKASKKMAASELDKSWSARNSAKIAHKLAPKLTPEQQKAKKQNAIKIAEQAIAGVKAPKPAAPAEKKPLVKKADYRDSHRSPNPDHGAPLHDLTHNGSFPKDVYTTKAAHYYGHGSDKQQDSDSVKIIHSLQNKPDALVSIYRAVPHHVNSINPGDWVSINRQYAQEHGQNRFDNNYKILEQKVPAKEVFTSDSIHEQGWHPPIKKGFLAKAPIENYDSSIGRENPENPMKERYEHSAKSKEVAPGIYHHALFSSRNQEALHMLSNHSDPFYPKATVYSQLIGDAEKPSGPLTVQLSQVHPEHKGKGHGKALYEFALGHHSTLNSDELVSPQAHEVYQHLKGKGAQVKFGAPDTRERHQARAVPGFQPSAPKLAASEEMRYNKEMDKAQTLQHFSPVPGLKQIDPAKQGTGADARTQGRASEHPHSFYYRAGTALPQEDSHIHQGAASRYEIDIPEDAKLYDLGTDPSGHIASLHAEAQSRAVNPGAVSMDDVHSKLKTLGFHGFFNSTHPSLSNVVGLYHSQPVAREEKLK